MLATLQACKSLFSCINKGSAQSASVTLQNLFGMRAQCEKSIASLIEGKRLYRVLAASKF